MKPWEYLLPAAVGAYCVWFAFFGGKVLSLGEELGSRLKLAVPQSQKCHGCGYIQYATTLEYLNLAVMNLARVRASGSVADGFVVVYSKELRSSPKFHLLSSLAENNGVQLRPVDTIHIRGDSDVWSSSFTKFHVFNQVDYQKLIYFDADSIVLKYPKPEAPANLDELFGVSDDLDISMPRAYWLYKNERAVDRLEQSSITDSVLYDEDKFDHRTDFFADHVMVLRPSAATFKRLMQYVSPPFYWHVLHRNRLRKSSDYDMEVMNKFADDQLRSKQGLKFGILDHRVYGVITGEIKAETHDEYLSAPRDLPFLQGASTNWSASKEAKSIKLFHFSDDPIPKPWQEDDNLGYHNTFKIVCSKDLDYDLFNQKYPYSKPRIIDDCDSVAVWDWVRAEFRRQQAIYWVI